LNPQDELDYRLQLARRILDRPDEPIQFFEKLSINPVHEASGTVWDFSYSLVFEPSRNETISDCLQLVTFLQSLELGGARFSPQKALEIFVLNEFRLTGGTLIAEQKFAIGSRVHSNLASAKDELERLESEMRTADAQELYSFLAHLVGFDPQAQALKESFAAARFVSVPISLEAIRIGPALRTGYDHFESPTLLTRDCHVTGGTVSGSCL
jgi:hypothetical protein